MYSRLKMITRFDKIYGYFILLFLSCFIVSNAIAEDKIGAVAAVIGTVSIERNGEVFKVKPGSAVFENDKILTGKSSRAQILLMDQTAINIGQKAELVLDKFVFNSEDDEVALKVTKGTFRFISGKVATKTPEKVNVETPVATIGVRGTEFVGQIGSVDTTVALLNGRIEVANDISTQFVTNPGFGVTIDPTSGVISPPVKIPQAELEAVLNSVSTDRDALLEEEVEGGPVLMTKVALALMTKVALVPMTKAVLVPMTKAVLAPMTKGGPGPPMTKAVLVPMTKVVLDPMVKVVLAPMVKVVLAPMVNLVLAPMVKVVLAPMVNLVVPGPDGEFGPGPDGEFGPGPDGEFGPGPDGEFGPGPDGEFGPGPDGEFGPGPDGEFGPGPDGEFGPGPDGEFGPGPDGEFGPGPDGEFGPGPDGEFGPGPDGEFGPGPDGDFGPGPGGDPLDFATGGEDFAGGPDGDFGPSPGGPGFDDFGPAPGGPGFDDFGPGPGGPGFDDFGPGPGGPGFDDFGPGPGGPPPMDLFYAGDPNMAPEGTFVFGDGFFEAGGDPFFVGIPGPDQFGPDGSFDQFGPGPGPGTGGTLGLHPTRLTRGVFHRQDLVEILDQAPEGQALMTLDQVPEGQGLMTLDQVPEGQGLMILVLDQVLEGQGLMILVLDQVPEGQVLMILDLDQVPVWVEITMIRWRGWKFLSDAGGGDYYDPMAGGGDYYDPMAGEHTMTLRLPTMIRTGVVSITTTMSFRISSKIKS